MSAPTPYTKDELDRMHKDPANWHMGLFYYNKLDPRLLPPKRYGWGWTTNFANIRSIGVMALLILNLLALVFIWKVFLR